MARPAGLSRRPGGSSPAILHRCLFAALLALGLQAGPGGALARDGAERPAGLPPAPLARIGATAVIRWREWKAGAEI